MTICCCDNLVYVKIEKHTNNVGLLLRLLTLTLLSLSLPCGSMPSAAPADSHSAALARLSLLAPPTLTVIHPTPEVSPVTPSPRKVSPLDVSQAQKTRSSGSGKRKAEGLPDPEGNNSTPLKEYRATFAPDPRSASFSIQSGMSHQLTQIASSAPFFLLIPPKKGQIISTIGQFQSFLEAAVHECFPGFSAGIF